jgi:two-component system, chemotaxis family, response regulator Rcp1
MNQHLSSSTRILVIEDNPIDVRLMRMAFASKQDWPTVMTVAEDGEQAIDLLSQSLAASDSPDFVILDLNLPKRDGVEVLQWIRSTEGLRHLPVAVVSSSPMDAIRNRISNSNAKANCYFIKPMDVEDFLALASDLHLCYQQNRVLLM